MEIALHDDTPTLALQESSSSETLKKLYDDINDNPSTKKILIEALRVLQQCNINSLRVDIVDKTPHDHYGEYHSGKIWISKALHDEEKRAVFIFELTNASQTPKSKSLRKELLNGKFDTDEEFTREIEETEFKGVLIYLSAAEESNYKDPLGLREMADDIRKGFEYYYTHCLPEDHKNRYRQYWREHSPKKSKKEVKKTDNKAITVVEGETHTTSNYKFSEEPVIVKSKTIAISGNLKSHQLEGNLDKESTLVDTEFTS